MTKHHVRDISAQPFLWIDRNFISHMQNLSPRAVNLYVLLSDYASNKDGTCWPSQETLAVKLRCHIDSVRRAVRELQDEGLVSVEFSRHNKYFHSVYTVLVVPTPQERVTTTSETLETPANGESCAHAGEAPAPMQADPCKHAGGTPANGGYKQGVRNKTKEQDLEEQASELALAITKQQNPSKSYQGDSPLGNAPDDLIENTPLTRFIHEGAQGGLWGDEITPNMMASGRFWLYDGVGELVGVDRK